jgi:hypothetical protein
MENLDSCINAMQRSLMQSRDALQIELSVSLFVFTSLGAADLQAKKVLRGVYASAGRVDCLTPDSPSYSSVGRYMERSAMLYEFIGKAKLRRAAKGRADADAIDAIAVLIAPLELTSWDDVMRKTTGKEPQKRAQAPGSIRIKTEHCRLDLAPEATLDELVTLRAKLDELIAEREAPPVAKRHARAKSAALHHQERHHD